MEDLSLTTGMYLILPDDGSDHAVIVRWVIALTVA